MWSHFPGPLEHRYAVPNHSPIILSLPMRSMSRAEMMFPGRTDRLPRKLTR